MESVLLVIQVIVALALLVLVLLQRSEGGALGIGGGPTGMMSSRGAANLLSKTTKWVFVVFLLNSLALGNISMNRNSGETAADIAEQVTPVEDKGDNPTLPVQKSEPISDQTDPDNNK